MYALLNYSCVKACVNVWDGRWVHEQMQHGSMTARFVFFTDFFHEKNSIFLRTIIFFQFFSAAKKIRRMLPLGEK